MNFQTFKSEILKRAKAVDACESQFQRTEKSENFSKLLRVITDNFHYCCNNSIIDCALLAQLDIELLDEAKLFVNQDTNEGFLIADSATVRAWGLATVEAWDSVYMHSFNTLEHKISEKAILRYQSGKVVLGEQIAEVVKIESDETN